MSATSCADAVDHPNKDAAKGSTLPPPHWHVVFVDEVAKPEHEKFLQAHRSRTSPPSSGRRPADALLDLALDEDLRTVFRWENKTPEWEEAVRESQRHPSMIVGVSDGGAHLDRDDGSDWSSYFLRFWVFDRRLWTVEEGVRQMTQVPAALCGFADRGMVLPGYAADLFLFDPDTVGPGTKKQVTRLPRRRGSLFRPTRGRARDHRQRPAHRRRRRPHRRAARRDRLPGGALNARDRVRRRRQGRGDRRVEVRDPGPTEVVVRIVNAGVCHSDISVIDGTIPWPTPAVLGHEGAGVVEAVGSAVTTLKEGDHVVLATIANCGMCAACNTGHPTWCRQTMGVMDKPFTFNGEPAWHFAATSVFAERTVVKETQAVRIDDDVPLSSACLIGCGVLTGVGAVLNRAKVQPGETAAVFGVGGVGLNVIQGLRIAGASAHHRGRHDRGQGAARPPVRRHRLHRRDRHRHGQGHPQAAAVREGRQAHRPFGAGGVNWAFECVGNAHVLRNAIDVLDWGGNCVIVGVPAFDVEFSALVTFFTHVDRGLLGCRYGSSRPHRDIPLLVELYKQGRLMLDELVSATYPLERFDTVVADLHDGKLARGVLQF